MRARGGLALLIVVGVLGILAMLATAFVTMAQLERRASVQRLHATKAALLARSGIEDALARLSAGQDPLLPSNRYGGEDWDALPPGNTLTDFEAAQEVYHPTGPGSRADIDACPVQQAMRPSFFARLSPGNPDPALTGAEGRRRGYSGQLTGDLAAGGNVYALKVKPGGLYVNGGDPAVPVTATTDYNLNLRRMLGVLAEAVDREDGTPGDGPVDKLDGENLVNLRPPTGWSDWDQVRDLALGGSQGKLDALRPYLTLHALVDRKVIRPNATRYLPGMEVPPEPPPGWPPEYQWPPNGTGEGWPPGFEPPPGQPFPPEWFKIFESSLEGNVASSWSVIKLWHSTYPLEPVLHEPGFERIPVLPTGKLVGRAPVDLAWARTHRPVLIALLANLKGLYLDEATATPIEGGDLIGRLQPAEIALDWAGGSDLMAATNAILSSTSDLATWDAWDAFCESLPFSGTSDLAQAKRDVLKANFNPNSRLNKFSPNLSLWRTVDKSDLRVYSTEFSLLPGAGAQELACVGRVLGKDGRLLASRVLRVSAAPAERLTLTTQKEFVCGDLGDLSMAGDEQGPRLPGAPTFISLNQGADRTWGHALSQDGLEGTSGASLQTYPEPCVQAGPPGTPLSIAPADYDGSIQLATIETPEGEVYGVTAASQDMMLLARYTKDFDLDVSAAAPAKSPGDPKWRNQPDWQQVTQVMDQPPDPSQLAYGLLHLTKPNTLYPDGCYSESARAPSYLDKGNAHGFHGVISFWIKSNAALVNSGRGHPMLKWSNFSESNNSPNSTDQFFCLADSKGGWGTVVCRFESGHNEYDTGNEHNFGVSRQRTPHRWSLVTMYYDFRSSGANNRIASNNCGELLLDDGRGLENQGSKDVYSNNNEAISAADITQDHLLPDGSLGPHSLSLGGGRPTKENEVRSNFGNGADATFDELAIYDFGGAEFLMGTTDVFVPAPDATLQSPGVLAADRFKRGRYYRESVYDRLGGANTAAEYFSPPIRLGGPAKIRTLAWTQVVPRGLQAPLPPDGQAGVDGDPGKDVDPLQGDDGRILLELTDEQGNNYLEDASGRRIDQAFDRPAASRVERRVDKPFRLHAVFKPNLADKENTPILDPLALDDVTVVYETLGERKIFFWEQGE